MFVRIDNQGSRALGKYKPTQAQFNGNWLWTALNAIHNAVQTWWAPLIKYAHKVWMPEIQIQI